MEQTHENLRKYLLENNYVFIKNFIDKDRAIDISNQFNSAEKEQEYNNVNKTVLYNFKPCLELLCEKTPLISSILGEPVLPTYAYNRQYNNSARLKMHTDRGACEITLSVHLDSDKKHAWPLWIKTPKGEDKSVIFESGDAVMYFGCITFHWRKYFQGDWYNQTMIHYVKSNGENSHRYFDLYDTSS